MKKLYIIRHAKSDWTCELNDFDRPLNQRGKDNATKMGLFLKEKGITPDLILSSSANRAISTARLISYEIQYPLAEIITNELLYHTGTNDILKEIWKLNNDVNTLFVIGHNPGLSELVEYLTDSPTELKTCCIASIEIEIDDWFGLIRGTCVLKDYFSPRLL